MLLTQERWTMKRLTVFILIGFLVSGWSSANAQDTTLTTSIDFIIQNSRVPDAFWSVCVRDTTGKKLVDINSDRLMTPASNLKLLTSAAVLETLGPDFQYHTRLYGDGKLSDHIWHGDVYVVGKGDPSISGQYYKGDRLHVFDEYRHQLDSLGIHKIDGYLIGNDAYFDDIPYPGGWIWTDLTYYYAVQLDALSFNDNAVDLTVVANKDVGSAPTISWFPFNTNYVHFLNEQMIAPKGTPYQESYRRILGTNSILLRSTLPQGYIENESLAITNPALYFVDTFKKFLQMNDIPVTNKAIVDDQQHDWKHEKGMKLLGDHVSPPLGVLLKRVNKNSDNFYTEMLLKTAAAEKYHTQGSTDLGIQLVKEFADSIGIDSSRVIMQDGSGLSGNTLISTGTITYLLNYMRTAHYASTYVNSLSVASRDGSLENRFWNSPLNDNIEGKTGYISGVRSISGYLKTHLGKTLIFSIITNHFNQEISVIDSVHKKILRMLYMNR